ncbi:hypothetical protein [Oceaniglobus ichthyenteri]|uniref:hypothetical protein n=1 Tax=Oceaniglobus ichthyenteri TaxID=2136177 RepID=UPI000D33B8AE|nr:hypothetical protein [Oceaniglobus ichthyenteri]
MFSSLKSLFISLERAVSFTASIAATGGLVLALYAFVYPAEVAENFANFQDLVEDARGDVARIATASEGILENTEGTETNTRKLADAIPYWVVFDGQPYADASMSHAVGLRLKMDLKNPSPYPITLRVEASADNKNVIEASEIIMPYEFTVITGKLEKRPETFTICLFGESPAFEGQTLRERRTYDGGNLVVASQSFDPIEGCE